MLQYGTSEISNLGIPHLVITQGSEKGVAFNASNTTLTKPGSDLHQRYVDLAFLLKIGGGSGEIAQLVRAQGMSPWRQAYHA